MADNSKPYIERLFSVFNINKTPAGIGPRGAKDKRGKDLIIGSSRTGQVTEIQRLWQFFLQETMDTSETLKNREIRYKDIDFMLKNDPIVQMAADLYADEAVQNMGGGTPVRAKAKSEVQSYIEGLLEQWGYTQPICRELIYNKVSYGDSFDANQVSEKDGIVGVTPLSVWDVKDRIEFDPSMTLQKLNGLANLMGNSKVQKLTQLQADIGNKSDPTASFRKYLLGFELSNGLVVPPWGISHYRSFSLQQEFAPFGRSRFINTLTVFRQLMASKTLMQVARAASFPRDLYEVGTDPGMTAAERWDACEEFQEQLDNVGMTGGDKEIPQVGNRLIVPKDSVSVTQLQSNVDPSAIADVEFLRDDEIISTFIPKGYLITDKASFGTSGQSLLQQFKPFGRRVFSDQSDFLRELTFKIKMHLAMINKFDGFDTMFELSMDFPVIEESSDRTQHKGEELDLAQKAVSTIKEVLGVEKIPASVVKDAFKDLSFLPSAKIDSWVNQMVKENEEALAAGSGNQEEDSSMFEAARNRYQEDKNTKETIREKLLVLKAANHFSEGLVEKRHYYSSCITSSQDLRNRVIVESLLEEGGSKILRESYDLNLKTTSKK